MTHILDCRQISSRYFDWTKDELSKMKAKPRLSTILFRPQQNPASLQYRNLILKDAQRLGADVTADEVNDEEALVKLVQKLSADRKTTGIMLFYPLKSSLKDEDVMDMVSPLKDVEGLHSTNLGYLIKFKCFLDEKQGIKCVVPATAKAVVKTIQAYPDIKIEGALAVIINNSMRVGKPLGLMLENLGATVIKCYDKTPQKLLEDNVRKADILITAVPDPTFSIDPALVKSGATVVDVSYQGNINTKTLTGRAAYVTSSDNRIGVMTRAMTFVNLVYCAKTALLSRKSNVPVLG